MLCGRVQYTHTGVEVQIEGLCSQECVVPPFQHSNNCLEIASIPILSIHKLHYFDTLALIPRCSAGDAAVALWLMSVRML
jgi:hypothetical protein